MSPRTDETRLPSFGKSTNGIDPMVILDDNEGFHWRGGDNKSLCSDRTTGTMVRLSSAKERTLCASCQQMTEVMKKGWKG